MDTTFPRQKTSCSSYPVEKNFPQGGIKLIIWPAFTYVQRTDNKPVHLPDNAGHHSGDFGKSFILAVPFPRAGPGREGQFIHKHFMFSEDKGELTPFGCAVSISDGPAFSKAEKVILAAELGQVVTWRNEEYTVVRAPNNNIRLHKV